MPALRGQRLDHAIEIGRAARIDSAGALHRQHHLVGVPVGEEIGAERHAERDDHAAGAADEIADRHEQRGQRRKQDRYEKLNIWPVFVTSTGFK